MVGETDLYIIQHRLCMEKTDILESSRHTGLIDLNGILSDQILSVQADQTVIRLVHAGQHIEDCGLSGAVWPDQTIQLPFFNCDLKIIYRPKTSKGDTQVLYFKHCHDYCTPFACLWKSFFTENLCRHSMAFGAQLKSIIAMSTIA